MLKLLFVIVSLTVLFSLNPTLDDFEKEAKRRVSEEESSMRASWSFLSTVTGLNAVGRVAGLGTYEVCRKNLYVLSLFAVTNDKLMDSHTPLAVAVGAGQGIWAYRVDSNKEANSFLVQQLAGLLTEAKFSECRTLKRRGDLTLK
jgi:hypothetical protein